jgi:predicted DNA-binding transcriptional regulator YafY
MAHQSDEALEIWIGAHIYVAVWCEDAGRELDLRLDRIVPGSISQHPRSATRRQRRGERIRYWLAPEIAQGGVSVRLEKQEVRYQADGSAVVSGIARSRFWARKLLLGYGSNARALAPPALVEEMRRTAEEMLRLYEDTERAWEIEKEER